MESQLGCFTICDARVYAISCVLEFPKESRWRSAVTRPGPYSIDTTSSVRQISQMLP